MVKRGFSESLSRKRPPGAALRHYPPPERLAPEPDLPHARESRGVAVERGNPCDTRHVDRTMTIVCFVKCDP